ncbi:VCBS repeat-containing protein [Streptomyces sp. MUM 136J]|uniref:FG-GAP-like repeat-containing protein n=1 Tax=Streptomyces sp. MUM 136J TaxID=2791992 RepID=UPI001F04A039|nr:FG-GAP-like repeat-containing protein [Streptomyces sp. MUM 136J]MCH0568967.1 VCBS repeat-containing protein [Streptomyces sp. MUM 136J]
MAIAVPVGLHLAGGKDSGTPSRERSDRHSKGPLTAPEAMRRARVTGKDVEVTAERTPNATTWAQPDGLLRTRTYSDTIRAEVGGRWQPIDPTLRHTEKGWAATAVNDPIVFSDGTPGAGRSSRDTVRTPLHPAGTGEDGGLANAQWSELVRMTTGGHEMTVSWPGPLPEPVVDGPRALYRGIRPGIDLLLTARDSGYSHVLIVHDRAAAHDPLLDELRYRLSAPELAFRLDPASHAVSALDADGADMASSPTPYAWDSAGRPAVTLGEQPPSPSEVDPTFDLPGLAGPQPGTHDAALGTALEPVDAAPHDAVLSVTPVRALLDAPDTVYPVFVDPSFKGHKKNWTLLYKRHPTQSFYNGQNFNDGTNDARVGYEATTGGLSRSVFTLEQSGSLHGATIKSAYFRALQTYSWGCSARKYDLWLTGAISGSSTWNHQPSWNRVLSSATNGYGYKSGSCPDRWVKLDVRSAAQEAADKKWGSITVGLRAANESDTNSWKKFQANGENSPYIEETYNRKPNQPTAQTMTPGPDCDLSSPYSAVGKSDLTFRAKGSDPDGNLKYLHFRVWPDGDSGHRIVDQYLTTDSKGYADIKVGWDKFSDGKTYAWDVRSKDSEGAVSYFAPDGSQPCRFQVDLKAPPSPTVTSTDFPAADGTDSTWSTVRFGAPGKLALTSATEVVRYEYSFNSTGFGEKANADSQGKATLSVTPPEAGPNILYVRAVDGVGNISRQTAYRFYVSPRAEPDGAGDTTGDGQPDLLVITDTGRLKAFPGDSRGDLHTGMDASYDTSSGKAVPTPDGYWTDALITHDGDWFAGDGVQDLLARTADGNLYVYPGDGYSGFDVSRRQRVLLPAGAPDASKLTQILSASDVDGDGRPDMFANYGAQLWIFTGYTGGSFATAHKMTNSAWDGRDLVLVDDVTGDGTADLIFRTYSSGRLYLREGKPGPGGRATDILSLGLASTSRTGADAVYGESGWATDNIPHLIGTPDADGDGIPDLWVMFKSGNVYLYPGGRTTHGSPRKVIDEAGEHSDWKRPVGLG